MSQAHGAAQMVWRCKVSTNFSMEQINSCQNRKQKAQIHWGWFPELLGMISGTTGDDFRNYWGRFPKLLGSISIHAVWFERSSLPMCTFVRYHTLSRTIMHGGTLEYAFRRIIVAFSIVIFPTLQIIPFPPPSSLPILMFQISTLKQSFP